MSAPLSNPALAHALAAAASHGIHGARGRFNADPRLQKIRAPSAAAFAAALCANPATVAG